MAILVVKNGHPSFEEIGPCAQNTPTILGSRVNIIRRAYVTVEMRAKIFTLKIEMIISEMRKLLIEWDNPQYDPTAKLSVDREVPVRGLHTIICHLINKNYLCTQLSFVHDTIFFKSHCDTQMVGDHQQIKCIRVFSWMGFRRRSFEWCWVLN